MTQPICLFDSGVGGLSVLKKLIQEFPNEEYVYLADLANVPYGDKTKEEIKKIALNNIEWLKRFNPKLIIMACNASSAVLQNEGRINPAPTVPLLGMIDACTRHITKSNYKKITVWATKLVVENNGYKNVIQKIDLNITVEEISCPRLVPIIEELTRDSKEEALKEYLEKTPKDSQAIILGCTHYPLIQEDILKLRNIKIIDPADALVNDLKKQMQGRDVVNHVSTNNKHDISFYTTAQLEKLEKFANIYLNGNYKVSIVDLGKITV